MSEAILRPYEASDRAGVRSVCYLTGYMGSPVRWLWPDEESFCDMFTGYYTDQEPGSATVIDDGAGRVIGYLLGCVDSRRAWNPAVVGARHAIARGLAFRPSELRPGGMAVVLWRSVGDAISDAYHRRPVISEMKDERWPAHLHIDLLPEARGKGLGGQLVRMWLGRLAELQVPGCHLGTILENRSAIAFFEAMGFEPHGTPGLIPGWRSPDGGRHHDLVMVQDLQGKRRLSAS